MPISELFVSVSADVSSAINGLTAVEDRLNGTTNAFRQAAPAALLLAGAGAAVEAGLVGAVKVAADFEHQMSGVRAVLSPGEVNTFGAALDALALKLGSDTAFTAKQAAAGIEELIKAGIPAKAVLEGAGAAALNLAAATGTDVATAATIAAQAMNAFKVPVAALPTLVDRLAGVVNVSAADMSDLRFGLQAAGAVAATVGLTFEDTAAALGIFANNGLRGQDAGTSLKTMLINLVPNTKQSTEAFKRLGLITADGANKFFDAQGHVKNLADISGTLAGALKGMTDQQKLATLQVLFGTDAMRAAAILARTGADGVNEFTSAVKQVSAADQAAERLNNLLGRLEQLGGSFQTVQIIVGKFFLPAIGAIADRAKDALNAFANLSPAAQRFITALVGIGGAAAAVVGGFVLLGPVIGVLGPSFGALVSLLPRLAAFFGPIGLAAAALATDFLGVRTSLQRTFAGVGPILGNFGLVFDKLVNGDVRGALDTFQAILGALVPGIGPILAGARSAVEGFFTTFGPVFANFGLVLQKVFAGDLGGAFDSFRAIVGAVSEPLGSLLGIFQGIAGFVSTQLVPGIADLADRTMPLLAAVGAQLGEVWDTKLSPALQTVGIWLSGTVAPFAQQLAENFFPALSTASSEVAKLWETKLAPAIERFGTAIVGSSVISSIQGLATALSGLSTQQLADLGPQLDTQLSTPLQALGAKLQPVLPVFQSLSGFFVSLSNVITAFTNLGARGTSADQGTDPLIAGLQRLADFVRQNTDLGDIITRSFGPFGDLFRIFSENAGAIAGFIDSVASALDHLALAIRTMPDPPAWLTPFLQGDVIGGALAAGRTIATNVVGPQAAPAGITPATGGGVNLNFNGPFTVGSDVDADRFLERISSAVLDSAGRVGVPPDNSSHPTLLPSVT